VKPDSINILGKHYSVTYVDKPSGVDIHNHESLWGQIDPWTHSIRIYAPDNFSEEEILDTILHEVLHVLGTKLRLNSFNDNDNHDELSLLAMGLADTFIRNGWLCENSS